MTLAEMTTGYSAQLTLAEQTGSKTTRTISDVLQSVAVGYMATNDSETQASLDRFNNYMRALANLTNSTYYDSYLNAKTSTNDVYAALIAGGE